MNALRQLLDKLSSDAPLSGDDVIALLLLITMIASLTHLLTMLATRWGDHNLALKSLLASFLIHCVCLLSLEFFDTRFAAPLPAGELQREPPATLAQIVVESDRNLLLSESGNTPVADRPTQPDVQLSRFKVPSRELTPPELPEPAPDHQESLSTEVPDVSQYEDREITELAIAADNGSRGSRQPAVADPAADLRTTFERNMADVPALQLSRTLPSLGSSGESPRDPAPAIPLAAAPELSFQPATRDVSPNVAGNDDAKTTIPAPASEDAASIVRRSAPVVSAIPTDSTGLALSLPQPRAGPASSFQRRLPRSSRSVADQQPAVRPSRESILIPQTPTPLAADYDDVRIGLSAPEFSDALRSAGKLVEADLPIIRRRDNPPVNYQLRNIEQRRDAARKFGGTQQSEAAVELSLRWLAAHQHSDGHWDAEEFGAGQVKVDEYGIDRNHAGREADTGVTALVTLCFLGAGYTHEQGIYAFEVDRGLDWLIQQQATDGNLCGNAEHFARMYCHGMATYVLAEAYGMQKGTWLGPLIAPELLAEPHIAAGQISASISSGLMSQPLLCLPTADAVHRLTAQQTAYSLRKVDDLRLRSALARAVTFTIGQQDPRSGGWRYKFGQEGDVSMFGWQMMSLKSAEIAGVSIDGRVQVRMDKFLNSVRQGEHGGLFGYRRRAKSDDQESERTTPVMTAEALFCQQMLGYPRETASSRESVSYLLEHLPKMSELNYYYWYYGTLAMYQYGGRPWEEWNTAVRDTLISHQQTDGDLAGSWDPNDPWGRYGGRLYSTTLATLTLEVYYRLLPLYRLNEPQDRRK